ncbi:MAG: PDDEXK nuclease domain-containing protein [Gammaproteobacteria bacterium]|nr:PDDEXK nuclease domain-containing protein [Gammaproteobacteria bacterium]
MNDTNLPQEYKKITSKLYQQATQHIEEARIRVQRSINTEMVSAYWLIGRDIVEAEQKGKARAAYGSNLLKDLARQLFDKYGKGFSVSTLRDIRQFYITYSDSSPIHHVVRGKSKSLSPNLGWVHYRTLMRIDRIEARLFYEIESEKNAWSGRELERQVHSLLFDRLAKSKDKEGVLALANEGQQINTPEDAIKEPLILEFLGLPESNRLVESELEDALITNLQQFLLELGKGFSFIGRQKRLTFDGDHFYADLVFYHVLLKCYVIVDLKTHKLTHADLGQMQLYVNYFDKEIKQSDDSATIGLVLCTEKSEEMAKYMLGDKATQIFASKYQLHLPTEEQLKQEIKREIKEIGTGL